MSFDRGMRRCLPTQLAAVYYPSAVNCSPDLAPDMGVPCFDRHRRSFRRLGRCQFVDGDQDDGDHGG